MTVTVERIDALGLPASFWNLPASTPAGESIEYFTFSGQWNHLPLFPAELRWATEWNLVAVQSANMSTGAAILSPIHILENDLWNEAGRLWEPGDLPPPDEATNYLSLTPDQFDALLIWLARWVEQAPVAPEMTRALEPVDIEALVRLGLPRETLWTETTTADSRRYLYHPDLPPGDVVRDVVRDETVFTLLTLSGWTAITSRASSTKTLRFDTYTPARLADILELAGHYPIGSDIPVPYEQWGLFTGCGVSPTPFTRSGLAALVHLLERHTFPQSGP